MSEQQLQRAKQLATKERDRGEEEEEGAGGSRREGEEE